MQQDEKEHLQKKGRLAYRPVEDEHGNFATSDKTEYVRDKATGSIQRVGGRKRESKKRKAKTQKNNGGVKIMSKRKVNVISPRVEEIFSQAVALEQSGRMKNTVFATGDTIYILNFDQTILLRFKLRKSEAVFDHPVSFKANDYDSNKFYEEDGKIVFLSEGGGFQRKTSCTSPGDTPDDIAGLFDSYAVPDANMIRFNKQILPLLEEKLSHLEISGVNGKLVVEQRNIYSGSVIELTRKEEGGFGMASEDDISSDFGPVGLRTNDFLALFAFLDSLTFYFPDNGDNYCYVNSEDPRLVMDGFISLCAYDELGGITESKEAPNGGRKEQKERRSERNADQPAKEQRKRPARPVRPAAGGGRCKK